MGFLSGTSTKSIDIMNRAMDSSILRAQVLNNNIANASTPNYKRRDVTFQSELERAINSEKTDQIPFKTSHKKHIPYFRPKDYRTVKPKVYTEYYTYQNNNGNNVDVENEMIESAKNTMYFNALAQRTQKEFSKLKFLVRS